MPRVELDEHMVVCDECLLLDHFHLIRGDHLQLARDRRRQKEEISLVQLPLQVMICVLDCEHCRDVIGALDIDQRARVVFSFLFGFRVLLNYGLQLVPIESLHF